MPFFRFRIHGDGNLPNGIEGFYTTRWCWASNQDRAAAKALGIVRKEVEKRQLGTLSLLEVEDGWRISVFEILKAPNLGYTFYGTGGESEARGIEEEASPSP